MRVARSRPGRALSLGLSTFALIAGVTVSGTALAGPPGMGMPGGPTGGPQGPTQAGKDDKEGPAEAAPKDKQALQPIVPVPAQPERSRRVQFFEAHGYIRMRADYFHRLDLGIDPAPDAEGSSDPDNQYFRPPVESLEPNDDGDPSANQANCIVRLNDRGVNVARISRRCERRRGISSANMRLRLSPTIHVSDNVKVHATVDALDNLVLGSTPDSFAGDSPWAPLDLYTRTQVPPAQGINSFGDSLEVKEAYGQIRFGWGLDLKFGRMFNQWGLGIVANDGNGYSRNERGDIVRMLDQDWGDSIDSVKLSYSFGKDVRSQHVAGLSYDWASSGPTTAQLLGPEYDSGNNQGQDYSAEKFDNVHQFSFFIERRDDPDMLRRKLSLDVPVFNYGSKLWLRFQDVDRALGAPGLGDGLGGDPADPGLGLGTAGEPLGNGQLDNQGESGYQNYANLMVHRRALVLTPDVWLRVNWRTLRVELEAAAVFGRFQHRNLGLAPGDADYDLDRVTATDRSTIAQGGYALEFKYGLFDDRFHLGLDQGFASGDQSASLNHEYLNPLAEQDGLNGVDTGDRALNTFRFNPAYMQDLLLFRELLGTAANAAYIKPWLAFYFFQGYASARLDIQMAFAHEARATYGNRYSYGLELDGAVRYHDIREPIFFQLQYGVMFPFGAFNRRSGLGYALALGNDGDARAAQTVQAQVGIKF